MIFTPSKFNMDTGYPKNPKNMGRSFQIWLFWVSVLNFRRVNSSILWPQKPVVFQHPLVSGFVPFRSSSIPSLQNTEATSYGSSWRRLGKWMMLLGTVGDGEMGRRKWLQDVWVFFGGESQDLLYITYNRDTAGILYMLYLIFVDKVVVCMRLQGVVFLDESWKILWKEHSNPKLPFWK